MGFIEFLLFLFIISSLLSFYISIYIFRKFKNNKQKILLRTLSFQFYFIGIWVIGSALSYVSPGQYPTYFWEQFMYIGILFLTPIWFKFVHQWTGKSSKRVYYIFFAISLFLIIIVFTDSIHHLVWSSVEYKTVGNYLTMSVEYGLAWWGIWIYSYTLLVSGAFIVVTGILNFAKLYKYQAFVILLGTFIPLFTHILYSFQFLPKNLLGIDFTPIAFIFTSIIYFWGINKFKLIDMIPIARDALFENMKDPVVVVDDDDRIVDMTSSMIKLLNIQGKSKQIIGKNWSEIFNKNFKKIEAEKNNKLVNSDISLTRDGVNYFYNIQTNHLYDDRENFEGKIISFRDISETKKTGEELKKINKELQESEVRFRLAAESSSDLIYEWNVHTNRLVWFGDIDRALGFEHDKFPWTLEAWIKQIHPSEDITIEDSIKRYRESTNPIFKEYKIQKKDGTFRYWKDSCRPIFDNDGRPRKWIGACIDITEQKMTLNELKDAHEILFTMNEELERKVKERTNEIHHLLKQKNDFINQLGHDLKNPLNPLTALLPILENEETNKEKKEMLAVVNRNVGYMKNLVVKTIELAKLNSSDTVFNFEETNLLSEMNKVIDTNKLMFEGNKIKVVNNIPKGIEVYVDKLRLEELFHNLLSNSVKYTDGKGTVTLDAKMEGNFVTVSVRDTGIGMTRDQLSHVFDEFFKADSSRHDFDSSGLGMPICKRIVERHGGSIWVESQGPGKGSTFYCTLPREMINNNQKSDGNPLKHDSRGYQTISHKVDKILKNIS
jgi:PAS domain S-box-containing protein